MDNLTFSKKEIYGLLLSTLLIAVLLLYCGVFTASYFYNNALLPSTAELSNQDNKMATLLPEQQMSTVAENSPSMPLKSNESADPVLKATHDVGDSQFTVIAEPQDKLSDVNAAPQVHETNQPLTPAIHNNYIVQVGRFADIERALHLKRRLESKRYQVQILQEQSTHHKAKYTVIIGTFSSKAQAIDLSNDYKLIEKRDAFITKLSDQWSRFIVASN